MPDHSSPSSTPNPQTAAEELNLSDSAIDKPRLKRRSLKGRSTSVETSRPGLTEGSSEPIPLPDSPRPDYRRTEEPAVSATSGIPAAKPASGNPFTSATTNPVPSSQSLPTTPLYYTTGVRKEKEAAQPMKTSSVPTASSTPASTGSAAPASSSATRPAAASSAAPTSAGVSRPAAANAASSSSFRPTASSSSSTAQSRPATSSSASPARPASSPSPTSSFSSAPSSVASSPTRSTSTHDYRANVERQSREQKSVGGMIAMIVYGLVGVFILGAILAFYGGYVITRQIHQQSVTMTDLDSRYSAENQALTAQLKASNDSLTEALTQTQAQLKREQELILRQQDSINRLTLTADASTAALRQEHQGRIAETANLKARVRILEEQPHFGPTSH